VFSGGHIGNRERRPSHNLAVEDDLGARGPPVGAGTRPTTGGVALASGCLFTGGSTFAGTCLLTGESACAGTCLFAGRSAFGGTRPTGDGTIGSGSTRTGSPTADSLNGCPLPAPDVGVGVEDFPVTAAAVVPSPD
jgi:hypothetical protein